MKPDRLTGQETHYKNLFDAAVDAILIWDLTGDLLAVNQAACEIFGYTSNEMKAMNISQILAPEFREGIRERLDFMRKEDEPVLFEAVCLARDGRRFVGEIGARMFLEGQFYAIYSSIRDITQRKLTNQALLESEAALRKSEAQLRSLVQCSLNCAAWFSARRWASPLLMKTGC
jgi:PAS domain S-box-containing protein